MVKSILALAALFAVAVEASDKKQDEYQPLYYGYGYYPSYQQQWYNPYQQYNNYQWPQYSQKQVEENKHEEEKKRKDDDDEPVVDKSGWYNSFQQYSNPWITYVANYNPHTVLGVCTLSSGSVRFTQRSN